MHVCNQSGFFQNPLLMNSKMLYEPYHEFVFQSLKITFKKLWRHKDSFLNIYLLESYSSFSSLKFWLTEISWANAIFWTAFAAVINWSIVAKRGGEAIVLKRLFIKYYFD